MPLRVNLSVPPRSRLALLALVAAASLAFFAWLIFAREAEPDRVLFGGLPPAEVARIAEVLDGAAIPYALGGDGGTVRVGEGELGRARMLVAGQGLPNAGPAGYELMDQAQSLGTTQFRDDITYLRALEGELARTIGTLAGVRSAKVHIVMPKREPFSREWTPPTASVLLQLASPDLLGREQVAAIRHLVASSVARLKVEDVAVVDNFGNLLARADRGVGAELDRNDQRRVALEDRIARAIEEQLGPIVGAGRVRAKVSAELDLSSRRSVEESFDPLAQVARSEQTDTEKERSNETKPNVSVERDLPENADRQPPPGSMTERDKQRQTINYEIGRTTREHVMAAGELKRLSISIAVDGVCAPDASGAAVCRPRNGEELAELERLARATSGFSEARGDTFEIASVPFSAIEPVFTPEAPAAPAPSLLEALLANPLTAIAGAALSLLVLGALGFGFLRARTAKAVAEARAVTAENEAKAALEAAAAQEQLANEAQAQSLLPQPEGGDVLLMTDSGEPMVDLGHNIKGGVRHSTIQRVQKMIDANLDDSVQLLRSWMIDTRDAR